MPSHRPDQVSRRAAFGVLGAGSVAFIAGCAPAVKPANLGQSGSPSASASSSSSSSSPSSSTSASESSSLSGGSVTVGEVKLEKYDTSAGKHEPATREHPPKNVPKPLLTDRAKEKSVEGLYENIAYIAASMQYLFQTGDSGPYEKCALTSSEKSALVNNSKASQVFKEMRAGSAWMDNPTIVFSLETSTPSGSGSSYTWDGKVKMNMGAFTVMNSTSTDVETSKQHVDRSISFDATYSGSQWTIRTIGGADGGGGFSI